MRADLVPLFAVAAIGLAGSSVAIASFVSKVWPAGFANKDPLLELVCDDPEIHVTRPSAVITTKSFVFPQFFR